jgi:sporulation protein YlmC with PRC-barrel domain
VLRYEYRASHIESEGGSMNTSELLGKQVMDKNGNNVGKVVDIDINLPQWTVNHMMLKIGMIKKLSIGIDIIDKVGDKIILKITRDELGKS